MREHKVIRYTYFFCVSGSRTWSSVRPRGGISPPVRSCFSLGVVPSSAFLLSIRPSTSHSAPPFTPMPSGFLRDDRLDSRPTTREDPRGDSWCDPVTRWDRSAVSLGSVDSTTPFLSSSAKFHENKRGQNRPVSMFSADVSEDTREAYENSRGMTLSDDSLHTNQGHHVTRLEPHYNAALGNRAQTLPSKGVSTALKGRVQSHELLNVDSSVNTDLRKSLARPVACLLVLGGKTRNQTEMGRTLDIWRCDIDPGKVSFKKSKEKAASCPFALKVTRFLEDFSL